MVVIGVEFRSNDFVYDYYCDFKAKKGDLVVVPTGSHPFKHFAVAEVVKVKKTSPKAKLWAVTKIDVDEFNERMELLS